MQAINSEDGIWLDMDPGIDDAWALTVAHTSGHLWGVSTVAGNVALPNTFGNAERILEVLGCIDVPVIPAGRERAWQWWDRHQQRLPQSHLIATGPLTNLAISALAYPHLRDLWKSITVMCGALPGSQVDKAQEFNIYVDPHAADVVFHWFKRVQLIGINVAHDAVIPIKELERLSRYGRVGEMLSQMLKFYSQRSRGEGGNPEAFPIDDVVAVAAVTQPGLFQWDEMPLAVVREGPLRGTVVVSPIDLKREPIRVAVAIDADGFRDWLWDTMGAFETAAPS